MGRHGDAGTRSSPPGQGGVFAVAEFRALWLAYTQSVVGDQLARVALSVLVFTRTGSPGWTAATYALTYLPALVSGVLLSGLADRFPRRTVMIVADLIRAGLVALMAIPAMPLPVLACLLVVVQLADAPFIAAQRTVLPAIVGEDRFEQAQRVMLVTYQIGQLAGFALAGVLVAELGAHLSLGIDAATFLASAALISAGVRAREAAAIEAAEPGVRLSLGSQVRDGARLIWADRRLRVLVALGWLAGFSVVPEGLAVPLADQIGAGVAGVGLLLAARPAGTIIGAALQGRPWVGLQRRLRWMSPMAVGTTLPFAFFLFTPGLGAALPLLVLSGMCAVFQVSAGATFVRLVPDHSRGQAFGLARSGQVAVQGIGVAAGGLFAQWSHSAAGTIGATGIAGSACALAVAIAWTRTNPRQIAATLDGVEERGR